MVKDQSKKKKNKKDTNPERITDASKLPNGGNFKDIDEKKDEGIITGQFEDVEYIYKRFRFELDWLKKEINDEITDDNYIYRFFRGKQFNKEIALKQLKLTCKWRKKLGMSDISKKAKDMVQDDMPHCKKLYQSYPHTCLHGYDRQGQPLSIERMGLIEPTRLLQIISLDDLMEYQYYRLENKLAIVSDLSHKYNKMIRTVKILDLGGLGTRHGNQAALSYLKTALGAGQGNYPEMLGALFIINTPSIFKVLFKIVKRWLDPYTLSKLHILGKDYLPVLKKHIDPKYIPKVFGGDCECEGGCVKLHKAEEIMEKEVIGRRKTFSKEFKLDEGDTLTWEYHTLANDIGFSVRFDNNETDTDWVVKYKREDCHKNDICGEYTANEAAKIIVEFDNSFSRFYSKTLFYDFNVIKAGDVPDEKEDVETVDEDDKKKEEEDKKEDKDEDKKEDKEDVKETKEDDKKAEDKKDVKDKEDEN